MVGFLVFQTEEFGQRNPIGFWSRLLLPSEELVDVRARMFCRRLGRDNIAALSPRFPLCRAYRPRFSLLAPRNFRAVRATQALDIPALEMGVRLPRFARCGTKKGKANNLADALCRLATLVEAEVPVDDEILCFISETSSDPYNPEIALMDEELNNALALQD